MGNSSKKHDKKNDWSHVHNAGRFGIYRNQFEELAEKHVVRTNPKIDESDYLAAYHQRYEPNKPIVNAYDAHFVDKKKGFCKNNSTISVFTEYIPHRLSDIVRLDHGQGIYVLSEALAGFQELFNRVGPFQVFDDLIGFNKDGEVRVWHNPNFADNAVDNDRIILTSTKNPHDFDNKFVQSQESDMVEDTFNSVARHTDFNPVFLNNVMSRKMGFVEARQSITSEIQRKQYYVPDHLFLFDKQDVIRKSGVRLKHYHEYRPNQPRVRESYPHFFDPNGDRYRNQPMVGNSGYGYNPQSSYGGYDPYSQPQYGYYGGDDDSSSSSDSSIQQGGNFHHNGQNYRVLSSKVFSNGHHQSEEQMIQEAMRGMNQGAQQGYGYGHSNHPDYVQVRGENQNMHDHHYPDYDVASRHHTDDTSENGRYETVYYGGSNPVETQRAYNQYGRYDNQQYGNGVVFDSHHTSESRHHRDHKYRDGHISYGGKSHHRKRKHSQDRVIVIDQNQYNQNQGYHNPQYAHQQQFRVIDVDGSEDGFSHNRSHHQEYRYGPPRGQERIVNSGYQQGYSSPAQYSNQPYSPQESHFPARNVESHYHHQNSSRPNRIFG